MLSNNTKQGNTLADELKAKKLAEIEAKKKAKRLKEDEELKKQREEVKRKTENILSAQRRQARINLQMTIDSRKRDVEILDRDLRTKEQKLAELKRRGEETRRDIFIINDQIKRKDGGMVYLKDQALGHDNRVVVTKAETEKHQARIDLLRGKNSGLETKYNQINILVSDAERKAAGLKTELARAGLEIEGLKKDLSAVEVEMISNRKEISRLERSRQGLESVTHDVINQRSGVIKNVKLKNKEIAEDAKDLVQKKNMAEEFDRESKLMSAIIARLTKERATKEAEIKDLERKMALIKD